MMKRTILIVLTVVFSLVSCQNVLAITPQDLNSLYTDSEYYWPSQCTTSSTGGTTGAAGAGSGVYILGDSITVRAAAAYTSTLQKKGIAVNIDASVSRSLNGAGTTPGFQTSGMTAIANDKAEITSAKTIVIALGTNGGDTNQSIDAAISAVRGDNPTASIYWVDTIGVNAPNFGAAANAATNTAIYSQASTQNFQVISWFRLVDPSGNPQSPSSPEKDPNGFIDTSDNLGVHPTPAGVTGLVNLVVTAITTGTPSSSSQSSSGSCCNTSASTVATTGSGSNLDYAGRPILTQVQLS
jgi:hypothetical protein